MSNSTIQSITTPSGVTYDIVPSQMWPTSTSQQLYLLGTFAAGSAQTLYATTLLSTNVFLADGSRQMNGSITFGAIGDTASSAGLIWNGSTDGARVYYQTTASDQGNLVLQMVDDSNTDILMKWNTSTIYSFGNASASFNISSLQVTGGLASKLVFGSTSIGSYNGAGTTDVVLPVQSEVTADGTYTVVNSIPASAGSSESTQLPTVNAVRAFAGDASTMTIGPDTSGTQYLTSVFGSGPGKAINKTSISLTGNVATGMALTYSSEIRPSGTGGFGSDNENGVFLPALVVPPTDRRFIIWDTSSGNHTYIKMQGGSNTLTLPTTTGTLLATNGTVSSGSLTAMDSSGYVGTTSISLNSSDLALPSQFLWVQGGSEAGGNTNRLTTTGGMPGNMQYNSGHRGTQIYSNGIAFADPYNGNGNNDAGWIRHLETTANDGTLEIATGDDASEKIVFRRYNTSNNIATETVVPNVSGTILTTAAFVLNGTTLTITT